MDTNGPDSVNEDNDGEIPSSTGYDWVVDISHLLSEQLGKQMPMMATYRVKGMHLSLRNVNDTVDNDAALAIGGIVNWYSPTKHRIDALQHARTYKRMTVDSATPAASPFGFWSDDKKYTGLRFNWSADTDAIAGAIADDTSLLTGTYFSLTQIFDHYNQAIGGDPINYGYDSSGGEGDALWNTRTGLAEYDTLYWNAAYTNRGYQNTSTLGADDDIWFPSFQTWDFQCNDGNHLPVLGGLLKVGAIHSNTDMAGLIEDDYYIQCTIMVEGWEEF